jgi:hypothetical protein
MCYDAVCPMYNLFSYLGTFSYIIFFILAVKNLELSLKLKFCQTNCPYQKYCHHFMEFTLILPH